MSAIQEFTKDSKKLGFIYKLKQSSLWTEYFCDNDQTHTIKSHSDFFGWGEMFTLLFVYLGTRFFGIISLDELLLQSVLLGKNLRRHQPFDHDEDFKLSSDDPQPISDQGVQNVLAHWIPRFIVDSFHDIVLDGAKDTHTITYKDTGTVLAPTLARHIEETYKLKSKQKDKHGQTLMSEFKYMVENEAPNDEGKSRAYLSILQPDHKKSIGKNSNTISSWPFMVPNTLFMKGCREPVDTLTKIWLRNMHTHSIIKCLFFPFYIIGKLQVCAIDIIEGIDFVISFNSNKDLQMFCAICNRDYHENVSLRGTNIIMNSDNEEESNDYGELSLKLTIYEPMKHLPLFSSRQPLHFL